MERCGKSLEMDISRENSEKVARFDEVVATGGCRIDLGVIQFSPSQEEELLAELVKEEAALEPLDPNEVALESESVDERDEELRKQ